VFVIRIGAINRHTVTNARNAVTPLQKRRFRRRNAVTGRVTPLLGRRTVTRLDHPARIVVQPIGRARRAPHHDLLLDRHDFDALIGQDRQRVVQTR
jgi:hypothetical protein